MPLKLLRMVGTIERGVLPVVAALVVLFAGCVKATPTPEPVSISFAHPSFDRDIYEQYAQSFNAEHPHITVELRPRRWDPLGGLNPRGADCFVTSQFALDWLHEQGNVLNLSPFVEYDDSFDVTDFYRRTVDLYTREGKTWALPAGVDMLVMYYNQDLFDDRGLGYPRIGWTWDDFLDTALALRDPNADTFGFAPNYEAFDPLTFIYQHGGRIFDDLENPTRTTFDDLLTIEALDWYAKLFFDHNVAPTPQQTEELFGTEGLRSGIIEGKFGVWSGMLSERGGESWPVEWPMRWGIAPLPRDAQAAALTLVEGYFVSSNAQNPDACWEWISFLSEQMPHRQAPVRRSIAESAEYEREVGPEVAAVVRSSMEDAMLLSPELVQFEDAMGLFGQAFEAIMSERSTPEEAMTWAQRESAR
jgi:multiple sugar transport system substrate-binding protein